MKCFLQNLFLQKKCSACKIVLTYKQFIYRGIADFQCSEYSLEFCNALCKQVGSIIWRYLSEELSKQSNFCCGFHHDSRQFTFFVHENYQNFHESMTPKKKCPICEKRIHVFLGFIPKNGGLVKITRNKYFNNCASEDGKLVMLN